MRIDTRTVSAICTEVRVELNETRHECDVVRVAKLVEGVLFSSVAKEARLLSDCKLTCKMKADTDRWRSVRVFRPLGTLERKMSLVLKFRTVHSVARETRMWTELTLMEQSVMRMMDVTSFS